MTIYFTRIIKKNFVKIFVCFAKYKKKLTTLLIDNPNFFDYKQKKHPQI